MACTKNLQLKMNVSADIAFSECKQKSLADCIKAISDRNYVGMSIRKEGSGNLMDLGSNDTRWLEGGGLEISWMYTLFTWTAKDYEYD
jgi:hypothetical protein